MSSNGPESSGGVDPLQRSLLVAVCQHLAAEERHADLVRVCALWSAQERLPVVIALDEARALLRLRLMDRAWVRLRELDRTERHRVEVQALTAEMFIDRGWPGRARKILERAVSEYPERVDLEALLDRSKNPPLRPPSDARTIEREGSKEERLALAELYLCTGSQLKARSILKRLARSKFHEKPRVQALLWALETDLDAEELSLMQLTKVFLAELPLIEDGPLELSLDGLSSAEVTTRGPTPEEVEDRPEAAFPSLFRWVDDSNDFSDDNADVTRISPMADLQPASNAEETAEISIDNWDTGDGRGDTKVMRVIHHDASGLPTLIEELAAEDSVENSVELTRSGNVLDNDVHTAGFNLRDMDFDTESEFLEEEDAGLIVMTRQEGTYSGVQNEPTHSTVNLKDLPEMDESDPSGFEATDPTVIAGPKPSASETSKPSASPRPRTRTRRRSSRRVREKARYQQRMFLAVGLLLILAMVSLLGWRMLGAKKEEAVLEKSLEAVGSGDYQALLQEQARLMHLLEQDAAEPVGAHMVSQAIVQLNLWGDFAGGRDTWEEAVQAIRDAGIFGASVDSRALASAYRAYFQGDLDGAVSYLEARGYEPAEAALLRAQVAWDQGDIELARDFLENALAQEPDHVMTLFTQADLCLDELDIGCARETVSRLQSLATPADPAAQGSSFLESSGRFQLLKIHLDSVDDTAEEQARRIEGALFSGLDLAPRQVGRARVRLAQLYSADGKMDQAKRSLEAALSADMESAAARFWLGALRLREGRSKQALTDFRACVRSRPAEHDCHRGVVHALLELDRVEEARLHVVGHEAVLGGRPDRDLFSAWLALAAEEEGSEVLTRFDLEGPRSKLVAGLAHGRSGQQALAESLLIEAAEGLESSLNALDQWMAPRAYAAAARFGHSEHRQVQADRAYRLGAGDPAVLVDLGWYYDSLGNKEEAALFFDRVDGVGQESAISHFNRGWFFLDFGDNQVRTKASWIRYRDLKPSGPRAERVMRQLMDLY